MAGSAGSARRPEKTGGEIMSRKTLTILAGMLAALLCALWWKGRAPGGGRADVPESAGRLLAGMDWESLRAVVLEEAGDRIRLERKDDVWRVAELDGYPADFERLRRLVQALDELTPGPVVDSGEGDLADYGLTEDSDPRPSVVTLEHAQGVTVLRLGARRQPRRPEDLWGPPPGRFARVDEGPVVLLAEDLPLVQSNPQTWWDRGLLAVEPETIEQIRVEAGGESFAIERTEDGGFGVVDGAETDFADASGAKRLFGALRNLRADRLLTAEDLDQEPWPEDPRLVEARTADAVYRVWLGGAPSESPESRMVRIEMEANAEARPEIRTQAERTGQQAEGRTFGIPAYLVNALEMDRGAVIQVREPEAVEDHPEAEDTEDAAAPESEADQDRARMVESSE